MSKAHHKKEPMREATREDAAELAQKLNLNRELVWKIIEGKRASNLTELALAIQATFAIPEPSPR